MIDALEVFRGFQAYRARAIVLTSGTAGFRWPEISTYAERDLQVSSTMGQTTATSLGVALGLPNEKVVLFDSEGALLMNLGALATIAGKAPKNFYHFLLDNECYATTGGQPVPNATNIDYAGLAKAAGYAATYSFDHLGDLVKCMAEIIDEPGPVFVAIKIVPEVENLPIGLREARPIRSRAESIGAFRRELDIAPLL